MKKRRYFLLLLSLILTFSVTSCGTSKQTSTDGTQKKQDQTTTETIAATNPEKLPQVAKDRKDTIVIATSDMEGKFLSVYSSTIYDSWVTDIVFDPLILNDTKANPIPNVAEKWEISPDGKTYTFHLKQGIKFTNGDELTADDVEFTYSTMCDPTYDGTRSDSVNNLEGYKEYNKGKADKVSGIKVIDKYTISFTEKNTKATALISDFGYGIMPKKVYNFPKGHMEKLKTKMLQPIGSGSYVFKKYKPGQEVDFEVNPNYFKGTPKIAKLIMRKTSADTQIQLMKAGEIDLDGNQIAAKPENISMLKDAGFLNMELYPDNGYGYIGLNCKLDMLKDKRVRQALTYGLNRKGFITAYSKGYSTVCNAPVSIASWAYTTDIEKYEYNPEKAGKLLDEAGWKMGKDGFRYKDGKKFAIHWMTYTGSKYVDTLIPILKENWKKIGVEVIPELMDFGTLCTKVYDKQQFEMFNMSWSLSNDPDPSGIFSKEQAVLGGSNAGNWTTEESEKLMAEGLAVTDQAKRKEIYGRWFKICNDELPYIFLDQRKAMYTISSRVKGIEVSPFTTWTYFIYKAELVDPTQK